jgi:flavin-dependent dehydrogenase
MRSFSALIVGAGPGGLACARILAENGIDVLVLEKKPAAGPKVCGGGITWSGLLKRVPEHLIEGAFPGQYIRSNWQQAVIRAEKPIVATVRREILGEWMCRQALEAGAEILTSCHVQKITPGRVITSRGDFGYRYLLGADGSASLVRKYLQLITAWMGVGIHYQVPGNFDRMEWHLNDSLFGNGYGWIFPFRDFASVGIYGIKPYHNARQMLQNLNVWAQEQKIRVAGLQPKAGLINFDYRGWRFNNIMLIGDAAGLASGLTGEGMYPALVSGETAARVIINPDYDCWELQRLIKKQQKHRHIVEFSAKNRSVNIATMEILILALRLGIIPFSMLEMGD